MQSFCDNAGNTHLETAWLSLLFLLKTGLMLGKEGAPYSASQII